MGHSLMPSLEVKSWPIADRIKYTIRELGQLKRITHQVIKAIIRWEEALTDTSTTIKDNSIKWLVISKMEVNHKTLANPKFLEHLEAAWISYQNILKTKPHSK
jgi:hypothetical protein